MKSRIIMLAVLIVQVSVSMGSIPGKRLTVRSIGVCALENNPTISDSYYALNRYFSFNLLKQLNDIGILRVKYNKQPLNYDDPEAGWIKNYCSENGLDGFILSRMEYYEGPPEEEGARVSADSLIMMNALSNTQSGNVAQDSSGVNHFGRGNLLYKVSKVPQFVTIFLKLFNKEGILVREIIFDSSEIGQGTFLVALPWIISQSIQAAVQPLTISLKTAPAHLDYTEITQKTWKAIETQRTDGTASPLEDKSQLYLCLNANKSYHLDPTLNYMKILPNDKWHYNSRLKAIVLSASADSLWFRIEAFDDIMLVLKPSNIKNVTRIYFELFRNSDIQTTVNRMPVDTVNNYTKFDEDASFMGGDQNNFLQYIASTVVYPDSAIKNNITGVSHIQFTIDPYGKLIQPKITKSSGSKLLDNAAMRAIESSPDWFPALNNGFRVRQRFNVPVVFKL